jgi:hypothetical protein
MPNQDHRVFDQVGLERLQTVIHHSPRDFGLESSLWTPPLLARICFEQGIVARAVSYETIRRVLLNFVVILISDNAFWHRARNITRWIRWYNQQAKVRGKPHLIVYPLPKCSP